MSPPRATRTCSERCAVGANPFYTQVGEDFLTLTYQAIAD
jgi:hypothetical protein